MKKKQIIIISAALAVLFILVTLLVISLRNKGLVNENEIFYETYTPEFMDDKEKDSFNLPEDSKIQILMRSEDGQIDVYKVIREDDDIEYDLEEIRKPVR